MDVQDYMKNDLFAARNDIELLKTGKGTASAKLTVKPHHLNAYRTLHGGALFTLADFAFAAACNSHGTVAVGINASMSYIKAVTEGEVIAEAEEVALGSKLSNYIVKVYQNKEIVAIFEGMAYRKKHVPLGSAG
ncbi:MAG: PaaI family thioesterase [Nitrospirota bacterium]